MHAYFDRLDQKFFKVEFPGGAKEQYTASSELTQPLFSWCVYRKLKFGRSGNGGRRGVDVT